MYFFFFFGKSNNNLRINFLNNNHSIFDHLCIYFFKYFEWFVYKRKMEKTKTNEMLAKINLPSLINWKKTNTKETEYLRS